MTRESTMDAFGNPRKAGPVDEKAPHKPLLVLLALSRWIRFGNSVFPYEEIQEPLGALIQKFGVPTASPPRPEVPFWHLRNDKIWHVETPEGGNIVFTAEQRPSHAELLDQHAWGRFWGGGATALERKTGPSY